MTEIFNCLPSVFAVMLIAQLLARAYTMSFWAPCHALYLGFWLVTSHGLHIALCSPDHSRLSHLRSTFSLPFHLLMGMPLYKFGIVALKSSAGHPFQDFYSGGAHPAHNRCRAHLRRSQIRTFSSQAFDMAESLVPCCSCRGCWPRQSCRDAPVTASSRPF